MRFCETCGTIVRKNESACSECGAAVETRKKAAPTTTPIGRRVAEIPTEQTRAPGLGPQLLKLALSTYLSATVCIVALVLAADSDWPYALYVILRLVVCAVSLYWAIQMFKESQTFWAWSLGANAILFNPVLPVRMEQSDWEIVNLLDAAFLASWMAYSIYWKRRQQ